MNNAKLENAIGGADNFLDSLSKLESVAYPASPRLCLYSTGLIQPSDSLMRSLLYHWI